MISDQKMVGIPGMHSCQEEAAVSTVVCPPLHGWYIDRLRGSGGWAWHSTWCKQLTATTNNY